MKSPSIQVNKDAYDKDKKFSPKTACPALELINTQAGNIGLQLQVPRGGAHPNRVGSEITKIVARISLFCYSWFRLQSIAIAVSDGECEQNTLTQRIFLAHISSLFTFVAWLKVSHDVSS